MSAALERYLLTYIARQPTLCGIGSQVHREAELNSEQCHDIRAADRG